MPRPGTAPLAAGLLVLTVAAYFPLWQNGFIDFDDELYITTNPHVLRGLTASGFKEAWTSRRGNYWQPLSWLSLQLDAQFFSSRSPAGEVTLSPAAVHGQNLFWHTASVLLLFALWRRLTGAPGRSFFVAALFAVHPMHVESVAWAAERKDVLSVFFGILTLWAYVRYLEAPGWQRYMVVTAAFVLSLLAKPTLMTLPFVLLLLDYWPLRRTAARGRLILEKVPLFALAAAIAVITAVTREKAGATIPFSVLPLSARLANALTAYGWYLSSTFRPWHLAVLYPHPYGNWSVLSACAGAGMLLVVSGLALWQARRRPWLVVGWLWFVGTLVPVIGLAQGGEQAWADRFAYWPHLGLFVAAVWGLGEAVEHFRSPALVSGVVGAGILGSLAGLTGVQVSTWRDTATLWEHALAVTRDNHRAHVNLGRAFLERGRFDAAEAHFAAAVRLCPDSAEYHYCLGVALLSLGKGPEAAEQFLETLRRNANHSDAWHNLGTARLRQAKPAAAARCFRKVLERQPESVDALSGLGLALWGEGKRQQAVRLLQTILRRHPEATEAWHGLGLAHLARGELDDAILALGNAVRIRPTLVKAHSDLGLAYGRNGEWADAVQSHLTAVRLQEQMDQLVAQMHGRAAASDGIVRAVLFRCRLAFALNHRGDRRGAAAVYRGALERDPQWPRKFAAKAWELVTASDVNNRDPRLAQELASQAVQAVDDPPASLLDALAAAQAALGQYRAAVQTVQRALDKVSGTEATTLGRTLREHLDLYQHGRPVPAGILH